ncbi:hypothetical protein BACI71_210051 [Bacillus mycoides]|uniref:Uncharacterized protein n=1 Tax=Bacillus mycoides TaxID=1405 RepID=A0A653VH31_BACMY|nr:hypothetical protein BACI71_210051 [Bacillus mycoides]
MNRTTNKKKNLSKHNQYISPEFCVAFMFELPTKLELHKKKWTNLYQVSPFLNVLINSKSPSVILRDYPILFAVLKSSQKALIHLRLQNLPLKC